MIKNMTQKRWKILGLTLLGIGLSGGIFFFPMNIHSQYTCLYHRMFSNEHHSLMMGAELNHHPNDISTSPDEASSEMAPNKPSNNPGMENSELLHRYILPFGFIWWFSLSLVFIGGYLVKRNIQNNKKLSSVLPEA